VVLCRLGRALTVQRTGWLPVWALVCHLWDPCMPTRKRCNVNPLQTVAASTAMETLRWRRPWC
jgi:hypothetical protein